MPTINILGASIVLSCSIVYGVYLLARERGSEAAVIWLLAIIAAGTILG